jgi:hypothetical protein
MVSSRHLIERKGSCHTGKGVAMTILSDQSYGNNCRVTSRYRTCDNEMRYNLKLCYIQVLFELQKYMETDACRTKMMQRSTNTYSFALKLLFFPAPRLDIRGFRFRPRFPRRRWTFDDLDIRIADRRRLALARLPTAYRRPLHIRRFIRS